jgi:hypothetical protein
MSFLIITNNGTTESGIHEPNTLFRAKLPAATTREFEVSSLTLMHLEDQLGELRSRVDLAGDPLFDISIRQDRYTENLETQMATSDVTRWAANRVSNGMLIANPTTPSVVATRRLDIDSAGEIYIDGAFFSVAAAADVVPDAEIDSAGAALAGSLATGSDRYAHVLYVNNADVAELVLVYGDAAATGLAARLLTREIAEAVGVYLSEAAPVYSFTVIGEILFEESAGLTQTTTVVREIPPSYA